MPHPLPSTDKKICLDISQPEHTNAGALLWALFYKKTALLDSLTFLEASGFPNNGGMHTLRLNMPQADLASFRELVCHEFKGHYGLSDFLLGFDAKLKQASQATAYAAEY